MGLDNNNPIVLTVVTAGASFSRSFSIKISQIECSSLSKGRMVETDLVILVVVSTSAELAECHAALTDLWDSCHGGNHFSE